MKIKYSHLTRHYDLIDAPPLRTSRHTIAPRGAKVTVWRDGTVWSSVAGRVIRKVDGQLGPWRTVLFAPSDDMPPWLADLMDQAQGGELR